MPVPELPSCPGRSPVLAARLRSRRELSDRMSILGGAAGQTWPNGLHRPIERLIIHMIVQFTQK